VKTIEFDSEFNDQVLHFLQRNYAKVYSKHWSVGNNTIAIFLHEEYVLRTSSNQSITIIFETGQKQRLSNVTVIASGGGEGLFGVTWGSQSAAENTFEKRIRGITKNRYSTQY
jgi:hypothetical protein